LSIALRNNADHLLRLDLDFIDSDYLEEEIEMPENGYVTLEQSSYFTDMVLQLPTYPLQPYFPNIRVLSLSQVPVDASMVDVINIETLSSLTLRDCPGWHVFTEAIQEKSDFVTLKKFELRDTRYPSSRYSELFLRMFLNSVIGLEELYICQEGPRDSIGLWVYVAQHHTTLRRFVHHQTMKDMQRHTPHYKEERDVESILMFGPEQDELINDPLLNPLARLSLECLGLSCAPNFLVSVVNRMILFWKSY
jgi:hypothetical protein